MRDLEDYSRSRVLARVEHGGFSFGVVRQRINGKPWRKYIVLVYNGRAVAGGKDMTDPAIAADYFTKALASVYGPDSKLVLKDELEKLLRDGARIQ